MTKLTPKNLHKNLGTVVWGGVIVLQIALLLSYLGTIGLNLGGGEAILWIFGGLILLNESVIENSKKLSKGALFPVASMIGGLVALVYGASLMFEIVDIVAIVSPYKVYLLVVVFGLEMAEAYTKG